jgi:hypothetical protein
MHPTPLKINYLDDRDTNKLRLNTLLASYYLCSIVDFPTRVTSTSATAIDNFFIETQKFNLLNNITSKWSVGS